MSLDGVPPTTRYRVLTATGLTRPRMATMAGARSLFSMTAGALAIVEETWPAVPAAPDTVRDLADAGGAP